MIVCLVSELADLSMKRYSQKKEKHYAAISDGDHE